MQAFEPKLTAALAGRWPDRLPAVLGWDEERAWLLVADAGTPVMAFGDHLDAWSTALPLYAELQRGEAAYVDEHTAGDVPDRRLATLPRSYAGLLERDLPLEPDEVARLRGFEPRFAELCAELAAAPVPETIQHDDLHAANVWARDGRLAFLDWGDACVSHPFASLVVTFRLLEEHYGVPAGDPWFERLRDAYLEPWGEPAVLRRLFDLGFRVGTFARVFGGLRQHDAMAHDHRERFRVWLGRILRFAPARL